MASKEKQVEVRNLFFFRNQAACRGGVNVKIAKRRGLAPLALNDVLLT